MKHFLLITFLFSCQGIMGQDNRDMINNFKINEQNMIYWQQISETDLTQPELLDAIVESGYYDDINVTSDKIICDLQPYMMNYDQYGFSTFDVASYITQNLITATVVFEYKGERYRTTIKNINFIQNTEDIRGLVSTLESHIMTKQQDIKFGTFKNGSNALNRDFTIKTTFKKDESEW